MPLLRRPAVALPRRACRPQVKWVRRQASTNQAAQGPGNFPTQLALPLTAAATGGGLHAVSAQLSLARCSSRTLAHSARANNNIALINESPSLFHPSVLGQPLSSYFVLEIILSVACRKWKLSFKICTPLLHHGAQSKIKLIEHFLRIKFNRQKIYCSLQLK